MRFQFPIIIIDEDFRSENTSGLGIRALTKAIEDEGMEVLGVTSYGDVSSFAQQQSRASAFILSIDDEEFLSPEASQIAISSLRTFVEEIRLKMPIFQFFCMVKPVPAATSLMMCCVSYMVLFTCLKTRQNLLPVMSCVKRKPI